MAHQRILFPIRELPTVGRATRWGDRVLVFESTGKRFRLHEDHPSLHGSHILGHEGELGCYAYYREATIAETAALEAQEAKARATAQAKKTVASIQAQIQKQGEFPTGEEPVGENLLDSRNIYGGGGYFVITDAHIWHVQGNSADGDDWSCSNVRGGIGYRVPRTVELTNTLRALHSDQESDAA